MIAILEVVLFGFMGQLVDWLATKNPGTLWQDESTTLITMGVVVVFGIPSLILLHSLVVHQTLLGNYPMAMVINVVATINNGFAKTVPTGRS